MKPPAWYLSLSIMEKIAFWTLLVTALGALIALLTFFAEPLRWFLEPLVERYIDRKLATNTPIQATTLTQTSPPSLTQFITPTLISTLPTELSFIPTSTSTLFLIPTPTASATPTATPTPVPTLSAMLIPLDYIKYGCQQAIYTDSGNRGYAAVIPEGMNSDPQAPENFGLTWDVSLSESFAGCTIDFPHDFDAAMQSARYLVVWIQGAPDLAQFEIGMVGCLDQSCTEREEWNAKITLSGQGRQEAIPLERPTLNGQRLLIVETLVIGFSHSFGAGSYTGTVYIGGVGFAP